MKHYHISFAHILCIINEERVAPLVFEIMKRVLFVSSFFWFQIQHNEYAQFHVYSIVSNINTHQKRGKKLQKEKKNIRHWFFQVDNVEKKKKIHSGGAKNWTLDVEIDMWRAFSHFNGTEMRNKSLIVADSVYEATTFNVNVGHWGICNDDLTPDNSILLSGK